MVVPPSILWDLARFALASSIRSSFGLDAQHIASDIWAIWRRNPFYTDDMAGYHVENFGCRTSQADGDAIASEMEQRGLLAATTLAEAKVIVVNTCTVTAEADRDARAYIRRVQRVNANARILVTGCYAQRAPQEVASLPGVSAVIGNSHKHQVAAMAAQQFASSQDRSPIPNFVPLAALGTVAVPAIAAGAEHLEAPIFAHSDFQGIGKSFAALASWPGRTQPGQMQPAPIPPSLTPPDFKSVRTRPSLKIQDGCGNRCTFCVIPTTRGKSRSLPRAPILESVRSFVDDGGTELVLSGINLGRWGRDLNSIDKSIDEFIDESIDASATFSDLVAAILETTSLPRLRISSVEPMDWSEPLLALLAQHGKGEHPRFARHAHLPLQSGSDAVLRRMHRRYRPWHYAAKLAAIHAAQPQAAIGADVMVGFPGETDAEFQENHDFIAAQPFTYLHLFPFSARPGTPAWELHRDHPVSGTAVQARMSALRGLIDEKNRAFRQSLLDSAPQAGGTLSVVTLETSTEHRALDHTAALSDNFVPVQIEGAFPANHLLHVVPLQLSTTGLTARPIGLSACALV